MRPDRCRARKTTKAGRGRLSGHERSRVKPGAQIEVAAQAAAIPERSRIAAASVLGVRTQRGQWWLPE